MNWHDLGLSLVHFLGNVSQDKLPNPNLEVPNTSSIDIKILSEQINFLKDANARLADSFDSYVGAIRTIIILIGSILTIITLVTSILIGGSYRSTIKELEQNAQERFKIAQAQFQQNAQERLDLAQAKIESELSLVTDKKIEDLKKIVRQEEVIRDADVVYINTRNTNTLEFEILKQRGFEHIEFKSNIKPKQLKNKIVILDLINLNLALDQNEMPETATKIIQDSIDKIEKKFPEESLLVIYSLPAIPRIKQLLAANSIKYVTVANNRITLVGAVVDSAYILDTVSV